MKYYLCWIRGLAWTARATIAHKKHAKELNYYNNPGIYVQTPGDVFIFIVLNFQILFESRLKFAHLFLNLWGHWCSFFYKAGGKRASES